MKKIWSYIAMFFIGLSGGIIFAVKYLADKTVYKGKFTTKQRGKGNTLNSELTLKTHIPTKREARKQANIIKRNEKKLQKAAKRLEKSP